MQGAYWVEDLGSTNGTLLNGEILSERRQINPGDRITFGKTELVFIVE
jgi:pSer/pThr/pTyr-binding forkhead associated (FHA) protein